MTSDFRELLFCKKIEEIQISSCGNYIFYLYKDGDSSKLIKQGILEASNKETILSLAPQSSLGYGGKSYDQSEASLVFIDKDCSLYHYCLVSRKARHIAGPYQGIGHPVLSQNGKEVLYVVEEDGLCQLNVAFLNENVSIKKISKKVWYIFNPCFSKVKTMIVWQEWDKNHMPWTQSQIVCLHYENSFYTKISKSFLIKERGVSFSQPLFSPNSKYISVVSNKGGLRHLEIYDLCGNKVSFEKKTTMIVGRPEFVSGSLDYRWVDNEKIAAIYIDNCQSSIYILEWKNNFLKKIDCQSTWITEFDCNQNTLIYSGSTVDTPQSVYVGNIGATKLRDTRFFSTNKKPIFFKNSPKLFKVPVDSSHVISCILYIPLQAKIQKNLPLCIHLHGGPTSQSALEYSVDAQFFASQGWAFCSVNYRGSSGFGEIYQNFLNTKWGEFEIQDAKYVALSLIDSEVVDPNKVILYGKSAGGYSALMAMGKDPLFWKGAIVHYGISDLVDLEKKTHRFESPYNKILLGKQSEDNRWIKRSPIFYAKNIAAPTLLFHGKKDKAVPVQQSIDFVKSVKNFYENCNLVLFDFEGHGFKSPLVKKSIFEKQRDFLLKNFS